MIVVVFGTTGELIKLAPVLRRLQDGGDPTLLVSTNQQVTQIPSMLNDFGLQSIAVALTDGHAGRDLETIRDVPAWLSTLTWRTLRNSRSLKGALRANGTKPLVLVHGDTMTTVIGAVIGRALGAPAAHIEAGLRSGDWRNPFPEELDRLAASKLATLHYAPGPWAADNLRRAGVAGDIVDTGANTVRDALALVPSRPASVSLPNGPFGVCSIHRFELLGNNMKLEETLAAVKRGAQRMPILFVDHPVTVAAIRDAHLERFFGDGLIRIPRQRYFDFISLLKTAEFLVTDSGGSQEECAALGIPCLIHRAATERRDGLGGGPVVLSGMELAPLERFLSDPAAYRRPPSLNELSPSELIVRDLRERGYSARA